MTYQEWRVLSKSNKRENKMDLLNFERKNPATAGEYKKCLENEKKRRSEIMSIKDIRARHEAIAKNMQLFEY